MSLEKEDRRLPEEGSSEKFDAVIIKSKISYPREFLLSLGDLDICKKLPNGFDESLLSEFEDAVQSVQDGFRPRVPGTHPLQGFKRNQFGSSPPTRGDSSTYSRGNYGKWESRSSGRSDRDSDSQSDRDSDSGKRYGHPSRQSWQSTEQDGLLGSGSFPRPIYGPKFRASEDYQLSKSNEPYHPPRPYKAAPYSRRDTDAFNDETFGSMECNDEDRAEEERRRRASFEMIRKEQQKALQEKQKLNLDKHKSAIIPNPSEVLEDKKEKMGPSAWTKELEVSAATIVPCNNMDRSSFGFPATASRPLVPPGFSNGVLETSSELKYQTRPPSLEEQKPVTGASLLDPEVTLVQDDNTAGLEQILSQEISVVNGQPSGKIPELDKGEKGKSLCSSDVPGKKPGMEDQLHYAPNQLDSHKTLDDPEIVRLNSDTLEDKNVGANRKFSTSILEKIFGGALSINDDGPNSVENHHSKPDDTWSCNSVQSSKFTQWFFEKEAEPTDDISTGRPNELLSLISGHDKSQYQVSDSEAAHFPPDFSLEQSNKLTLNLLPAVNEDIDQTCANEKNESVSTVITCEDLEQSILTEYGSESAGTKPFSESWNTADLNTEQTTEQVDGHASLHILSLLRKGSDQNKMNVNSEVGCNLEDKPLVSPESNMAVNEHKHGQNGKSVPNSGKTITLEALFGSAFMKELQSVEAPVSIQRGPNEANEVNPPESLGLLFPITDNVVPSSATDVNGLQGTSHNPRLLSSNDREQMWLTKAEKRQGLDGSDNETISTNDQLEEVSKHDSFRTDEIQPPGVTIKPEVDSLSHRMLTFMPAHDSMSKVEVPSNGLPIRILDNPAPINAARGNSENILFMHPPYQNMDPQLIHPSLQVQLLPQFQPPQMAQLGPLHNNLECPLAHMNSPMKFLGPEPMFSNYSSANHQFPPNMIQHPLHDPNINIPVLDVQSLASMHHQMQLSGNHSLLPEFPRGGQVSHPSNQAAGFIQEISQVQGFPREARQPNIYCPGLPIPGVIPASNSNSGHNPPEFFQRLIEMGIQANSKHDHPSAPGYSQGLHSHGLDMGFQYR